MTLGKQCQARYRHAQVRRSLIAAGAALILFLAISACGGGHGGGPRVADGRTRSLGPAVTSVTPDSGSVNGGEAVTITGSGFVGPARLCARRYDIWFGKDAAEGFAISPPKYTVLSDTEIRAVVPANYGGTVDVQVHNRCGTSGTGAGDGFTYAYPANQCLGGSCSISIGSSAVGPLTHAADGLLNGFNNLNGRGSRHLRALLDALSIRQWRMDVFNPAMRYGRVFAYCDACRGRTAISFDLTTDWQNAARAAGSEFVHSPFGDVNSYAAGMYDDVRQRLHAHQPLAYFDVWNEPDGGTIQHWLSTYGAAYRGIKAADPAAQLVGPSIDTFLTASPDRPDSYGYKLDLTDFLDWEMQTGVRFAAISWHENGAPVGALPSALGGVVPPAAVPGGRRDDWSPAAIGEHVLQARRLLSRYPALRATKLFVNEYGPPWAINIPGWMVGDFAALEWARASEAMMTCASDSACSSLFDGLIGFDGQAQMPYWVLRAYAQMRGERLAVATQGRTCMHWRHASPRPAPFSC